MEEDDETTDTSISDFPDSSSSVDDYGMHPMEDCQFTSDREETSLNGSFFPDPMERYVSCKRKRKDEEELARVNTELKVKALEQMVQKRKELKWTASSPSSSSSSSPQKYEAASQHSDRDKCESDLPKRCRGRGRGSRRRNQ